MLPLLKRCSLSYICGCGPSEDMARPGEVIPHINCEMYLAKAVQEFLNVTATPQSLRVVFHNFDSFYGQLYVGPKGAIVEQYLHLQFWRKKIAPEKNA